MEAEKNSSTSSSKGLARIWTALAAAGVVLLCFQALVMAHKVPPGEGVSQMQQNTIRLQRYLDDPSLEADYVLVGSSIAANIKVQDLDPKFVNLGVYAGSPRDGLEVVLASPKKPKEVFIEITFWIARGLDEKLHKTITDPSNRFLYKNFAFIRPEYQPVNVLLTKVKKRKPPESVVPSDEKAHEIAQRLLSSPGTFAQRDQLPAEVDWILSAARTLQSRGITVTLLEMPVEPEIEESPQYQEAKQVWVEKAGHDPQFSWLSFEEEGDRWRTTDGWHLVRDQAVTFAEDLITAAGSDQPTQ